MITRYDVTRDELAGVLDGEPRYRLDQLWAGLYTQLADPADITNLPKALRTRLDAELPTALTAVTESVSDGGDTVKFLWELDGGSRIETVLMLYADRATVCVSSQAGCAMACGFCATGQAGFARHLTVGEIVEQVVRASQRARQLDPSASATSCSWEWASRWRTSTRCGGHRAVPRRPRAVGAAHHDLDRRHHPRDPFARRSPTARSTSRCRSTPPTTPSRRVGPDQQAIPDRRPDETRARTTSMRSTVG